MASSALKIYEKGTSAFFHPVPLKFKFIFEFWPGDQNVSRALKFFP